MATALVQSNQESYRTSTDAAGMCRDIVVATASKIQGRNFVSVEGWQAIAVAHGCAAGARDVEKVDGGVRAIGEVRRMLDGVVISTAEGFVGEDEPTWYGGDSRGKILPKRPDYAIRAMAQTRAISRACRSAFAHVVVMMKANLETTPAEEVPQGGFDNGRVIDAVPQQDGQDRRKPSAEGRPKPIPLTGKHKTRRELREAAGAVQTALSEAVDGGDESHVETVLTEWQETIDQIQTEAPVDWWKHPDWGLEGQIERARKAVAAKVIA